MARLARPIAQKIEITDFSGGLNTESPPLSLSLQEATVLVNWVPLLGALRTRNGFRTIFALPTHPMGVFAQNGVVWTVGFDGVFCRNDRAFGRVQITNDVIPKFAWFDPHVCIATGRSLYLFDTQTNRLQQTNSPLAVDVLVKDGRVWIASGDMLYASAIGDPTSWENNLNNPSSAQFFQIGYKDGGQIVGLAQVYDDILIFKTTGLFRLRGEIPNVVVESVAKTRTAINNASLTQLGTDAVAIDNNGAYIVGTAMKYGDLVMDDVALKVKRYLLNNYDGYVAVLPPIRAVAFKLKSNENHSRWLMYFYQDKAWIEWHLSPFISLLASDGKTVYGVGRETSVYGHGTDQDYLGHALYSIGGLPLNSTQNIPIYPHIRQRIRAIYRSGILASMDALTLIRMGVATDPEFTTKTCVVQVGSVHIDLAALSTSPLSGDPISLAHNWGIQVRNVSSVFRIQSPSPPIHGNNNPIHGNSTPIYSIPTLTVHHQHIARRVPEISFNFFTLDSFTLRGLYCDVVPSGQ